MRSRSGRPATLVELAGVRPPATWPGRDLLAALRRDPKQGLEDAFSEWADENNQRFGAFRLVRTPRQWRNESAEGADRPAQGRGGADDDDPAEPSSTISTRRFWALPAEVPFEATGLVSP